MDEIGAVRNWLLAFVLLAGGGFGLLIGIGCAIGANACPFKPVAKQTSTDGPMLYANNCAACHGRTGTGGAGPSLVSGSSLELEGDELAAKIGRGKPLAGMPRFSRQLSQEQIKAIAAYIEAILRKPAGATP